MDTSLIYILTNKSNGKRYVGLARKSFAGRLKDHFANKQSIIGKALRKYGVDGFDIQKIVYDKDDLPYWEKYFISGLNTKHPNGYNLTDGGEGLINPSPIVIEQLRKNAKRSPNNRHFGGHQHSEESKKRISESLLVAMSDPDIKKKMSEAQTGRVVSEETKRKISLSKQGQLKGRIPWNKGVRFSGQEGYVNPMQGQKRPDLAARNILNRGRKDSEESKWKKHLASVGRSKSVAHAEAIKRAFSMKRHSNLLCETLSCM